MESTFEVYARCRPLNERERTEGHSRKVVRSLNKSALSVSDGDRESFFVVDRIFREDDNNETVFKESVKTMIESFLDGINCTVLAYGITGAGKSHTMFGSKEDDEHNNSITTYNRKINQGIIEQTIEYIFECKSSETKLKMSYIEIYNEQVLDLLGTNNCSLQIIEDSNTFTYVADLTEIEIESPSQAQAILELGNSRRVVAETKANSFSSRSHAIVQIVMSTITEDQGDTLTAKFCLVDLAGSEKQSFYHENKAMRTIEGSNINRSLLTLGNCIKLLSEKRKNGFIPYRDSKLTRLLKDSLGGNTRTVMLACISISWLCYDETLNTLKYACRAKKIDKVITQNYKQKVYTSQEIDAIKDERDSLQYELNCLKSKLAHNYSSNPPIINDGQLQITKGNHHYQTQKFKQSLIEFANLCSLLGNIGSETPEQLSILHKQKTSLFNNLLSMYSENSILGMSTTPKIHESSRLKTFGSMGELFKPGIIQIESRYQTQNSQEKQTVMHKAILESSDVLNRKPTSLEFSAVGTKKESRHLRTLNQIKKNIQKNSANQNQNAIQEMLDELEQEFGL